MAEEQKLKTPSGWVDRPWDGSAGQWDSAEAYCAACLIDANPPGKAKVKDLCALPVKEPNGKTNVRGVLAAAGGRGITRVTRPDGVSAEAWARVRRAAARKLMRLYGMMRREAPETVRRMAGER